MNWQYHQTTGVIILGAVKGTGYSGFGEGKNNPDMEAVEDVGPIPAGLWRIMKPSYHHPHLGPIVMNLIPVGHDAHKRTVFRIHGDNETHDASHGCIVQDHNIRLAIEASTDCMLEVVR